ncbi:hypothetical protein AS026_26540 [Rhizobium altiplani]|uniref:Uncharacterized protein n=1 Tax=Rhizobium altiplani TaxID=1864509 RepID=A0A109J0V3_9HYPH|nr:hypothetical protein [Rhizobium altiplani]KWV40227.1 hypothetical protein AS026_26540 [Rhizobium altiplani]
MLDAIEIGEKLRVKGDDALNAETVERVNQTWWSLPEREVVPLNVLERIDAHVKMLTPVLGAHAH